MSRILPNPLVFLSGYANTENVFYCLSGTLIRVTANQKEGCPILTNRLHWWLACRTRDININYSALLLVLKANLFRTNWTIGVTSFSIRINRTISANGPSELTNRIRWCILDMRGGSKENSQIHSRQVHWRMQPEPHWNSGTKALESCEHRANATL